MSGFGRSVSFKQRAANAGSPRLSRKTWVSRSFQVLIAIGSFISFLLAIGCAYLYVLPNLTHAFHDHEFGFILSDGAKNVCDVFDGEWVLDDDSYPLYNASHCPFVEQGFNCLANGRTDDDYLKWRWKPKGCNLPRVDVYRVLEAFRNKRIVFVGDSMSRTQWESLICLLMTGVEDQRSVYEVNGNTITKQIRFLGVRGCYFEVGTSVELGMTIAEGYRTALQTWASWVESAVNPERTRIFFRTFEPSHWRNLTLRQCNVTKSPLTRIEGNEFSEYSDTVLDVVHNMTVPVTVVHITPMSAYRSDAHVGTWSDRPSLSDCSHWCLPGLPDIWNEIVLWYLFGSHGSNPK
ncbi:protein trichome berefringence-like 7 isoform X2 [Andrographis paniculata]|uniref:protein trichome berefringence-like 7 isoform X2 n=1 Tax=Andrographis paniculata TaxID=175694 RepID=UPI0021E90EC6|nr:protein trichome berefringence-like 7 isoform X2 [Andrographis paniculata]